MTSHNARYLPVLRALAARDLRVAVIGSAGIALRTPTLWSAYALPDVDLVIDPDLGRALDLARWLASQQWRVTVWGVDVDGRTRTEDLAGKIYFRATRDGLRLDVTWEHAWAPRCLAAATLVDGVPVAPRDVLWAMKRAAHPDAARRLAARFGVTP